MKRYALIGFLLSAFVGGPAFAQPKILWQKCLGGSGIDDAYDLTHTSDGGLVMAGDAGSIDGDVSGFHGGGDDAWLVKLSAGGAIEWQKCYGGTAQELFRCVIQTSDGGYAMAGQTTSNDVQVSGNHGGAWDGWVVKVDDAGAVQWQRCLGGSADDELLSIIQTSDGNYVVAGETQSMDGDVHGNHGHYDAWVVELGSDGSILWQKCLGGTADEYASCLIQTSDGGYAVGCYSTSNDGDVSGWHGESDAWIVKLNNAGAIEWEKCYGGTDPDWATAILQSSDGNFVFAGNTNSNNGDAAGDNPLRANDIWIVKLDQAGNLLWQKTYGTYSEVSGPQSIVETADHGYSIAGSGYNEPGNHGSEDEWVFKIDDTGAVQWQRSLGGSQRDQSYAITPTIDGNFAIAGITESNDRDVSGNHGNRDAWVVKLAPPPPPPIISYITPDAGAPGMCVAVEVVAPASAQGGFGGDQVYTDGSLVKLTRASDSAFVRLGPSIVSWNGRLIQQMFMIEPNIKALPHEVYFQVVVNGVASTTDSFDVVAPFDFGTQVNGGVLLGASRTHRNTMVVDSMTLMNGTFTLPTTDPDLSTPGNQAYLPLRILSLGPIRLINASISATGLSGNTGTGGGAGAPGGGGGGSGYPGYGGAGYTGGGGDNDNSNGPGGAGTGSVSASPTGGISLNGVDGGNGEQHSGSGGDDGGGGGTGLPFGTSGTNGGPSSSPSGEYGGGSAGGSSGPPTYSSNYGGGGGGNLAAGSAGQGSGNDGGNVNGNSMLVPLFGGSGGGAGNQTYFSLFGGSQGGCGGGGGGAVELTSFAALDFTNGILGAQGGSGSSAVPQTFEPAAGGGGGSGGAISLSARDSVVIRSGEIRVSGGSGGSSSSSNSNGGSGSVGRVRINGFVSKYSSPDSRNYYIDSNGFTGPS
ncbi:MAG TPA: hypothetical protein VFH95_05395, partial [Candidatus Kapabacteria bacterium]|nr:hypothetical protein [Candidatus Kapabacteria bacterium]